MAEITVPTISISWDRFNEPVDSLRKRAEAEFKAELNKAIGGITSLTGTQPSISREAIDTYIRWKFARRYINELTKGPSRTRSGPQSQIDAVADALGLPGREPRDV
jgi:hypothetical protein